MDCLIDVAVAPFCLDVNIRCLDCIWVADVDCISNVTIAVTLDDVLVADVVYRCKVRVDCGVDT